MDEVDNTAENNIGLIKRGEFTNNGTEVGLVGVPLYERVVQYTRTDTTRIMAYSFYHDLFDSYDSHGS